MKPKAYLWILLMLAMVLNIYLVLQLKGISDSYSDTLGQVSDLREQIEKYTADVNAALNEYERVCRDSQERASMAVQTASKALDKAIKVDEESLKKAEFKDDEELSGADY